MMSKEKRRVPKLRFPGFTEDWEQRKVNDLFNITRGQVLATSLTTPEKTSENIYPVYSSQTKNNGLMGYYSEYLFEDAITWTTDGANAGTVNFRPGRFYSTNVNGVLINENGYACYAVSEIINKVAYKYVSKVGNPKLMNNVMAEIDIMITSDIDELGKISALIESYNQYITLHQRKLDNLKLKKKALLQKLFPKNGERYPELRFPGFTDAWEQRKLIDIAKTFIGLVTTMTENYRDSGTLLIRNSDIKEGQFVFSENPIHLDEEFAEKNKTRKLQIGDVVTVHTGDIGTSAVIEEKEAGAIGFATINTRTDKSILNPYFLATYFNTEKHKCYANSVSTGDGRSNYNIKDFNKLVISIPTLDEQERISVLINDINTIITLHQRKLDHLQLQKKVLLQQMFV